MNDDAKAVCPHCGAAAVLTAKFCGSCGLAMPSAAAARPRVVGGKNVALTAAGQKLQADELLRTARQAARTLLTIGIINLGFGMINIQMLISLGGRLRPSPYMEAITTSMMVAGALYVGMFFWAKYSPLAATIMGLAVYTIKWVVDIAIRSTLYHPARGTSNAPETYQFFRLLMVFYLIRGVVAAMKHRRLMREAQKPSSLVPVLEA